MTAKQIIQTISTKSITNNTQRVGRLLLLANGEWQPRSTFTHRVSSAMARIRDLRKDEYGNFQVECKSSDELNRKTSHKTFYYRIRPTTVKPTQVKTLFKV